MYTTTWINSHKSDRTGEMTGSGSKVLAECHRYASVPACFVEKHAGGDWRVFVEKSRDDGCIASQKGGKAPRYMGPGVRYGERTEKSPLASMRVPLRPELAVGFCGKGFTNLRFFVFLLVFWVRLSQRVNF